MCSSDLRGCCGVKRKQNKRKQEKEKKKIREKTEEKRKRSEERRVGKECYGGLRNKTNLPLSGKGKRHTPLVVGKYTQTRQRRLRGKMVKTGHGRHYKRTFAVP